MRRRFVLVVVASAAPECCAGQRASRHQL